MKMFEVKCFRDKFYCFQDYNHSYGHKIYSIKKKSANDYEKSMGIMLMPVKKTEGSIETICYLVEYDKFVTLNYDHHRDDDYDNLKFYKIEV